MDGLSGQRVVVTRAEGQAREFTAALREAGAEVIEYPVIEIVEPESWEPVDRAIANLDQYDWLVFTSANAVRCFFQRAADARVRARIVAVGPATRKAIEDFGHSVDLVPEEHIGEGVVAALAEYNLRGTRILLPRAAVARDVVPQTLRELGAEVDVVDVYRNVLPQSPGPFPENVDWITFTSASTVKNLLALVDRSLIEPVRLASIGPETTKALRKHGLDATVEASPSTMDDLLAAMDAYEDLPVTEYEITDVLDLHTFNPADVAGVVEEYLAEAHQRGFRALRIIHGRGIGVQRQTVLRILSETPFVDQFGDAPAERGGWGVTLVTLKPESS